MTTGRTGRLNWLQQNWLRGDPDDAETAHENNVRGYLPTADCELPALLTALTTVVARHESLRTTVEFDVAGNGRQAVAEPPRSPAGIEHLVELAAEGAGDEMAANRWSRAFDLRSEWPVGFVVTQSAGRAAGVHLVVDHSAVDGWGLKVLIDDLRSALTAEASLPAPVTQPLDTVDWEDSAEGVKRSGLAVGYWRRQLRGFADLQTGSAAGLGDLAPPGGGSGVHRLESVRLQHAAELAAARFSVSGETVFLCAYGWALASFHEKSRAGLMGLHFNRLTPAELRSAALRFTQSPLAIGLPGTDPIDGLVKRVHRERLESIFVGHAHPEALDVVVAETLPHALAPDAFGAYFNYLRPDFTASSPAPGDRPVMAGTEDEVIVEDLVLARGAELMLAVEFDGSVTNVRLTSARQSAVHQHGSDFLRLLAAYVYWLAAGTSLSEFPRPAWR